MDLLPTIRSSCESSEPAAVGRPVERAAAPEADWIETSLRGLYDAVLDEPVPPHLLAMLEPPPELEPPARMFRRK